MEENKLSLIGEKFPNFEAKTTHGKIFLPDEYFGKWFVFFSHPGDFTPVCTTEFVAFQKRFDKFKELNCELIGLSIDQVFSHLKWVEWIKEKLNSEIRFPIIADDTGKISNLLGMIAKNKGTNTIRAVFIVDDKSVIRTILYYPQELGRNIDEILRIIKALQTSDKNSVAMPANWPENELIGNKAIIPPASNEKEIQKRREKAESNEIECRDWWFCYKSIQNDSEVSNF